LTYAINFWSWFFFDDFLVFELMDVDRQTIIRLNYLQQRPFGDLAERYLGWNQSQTMIDHWMGRRC
jgi:hypothetical protein